MKTKSRRKGDNRNEPVPSSFLALLLSVLPPRFQKPFSATFLSFGILILAYSYRDTLNDFFFRFVLWTPYSLELLSSRIQAQHELTTRDFKEILSYSYSSHTIEFIVHNNLKLETVEIDSVNVYNGLTKLQLYAFSHSNRGWIIPPEKSNHITMGHNNPPADSLTKQALLNGDQRIEVYTNYGQRMLQVSFFDFFDVNGNNLHSIQK